MTQPPIIVYCDFDGTATQVDVIDVLLTELAHPDWRLIEAEWQQGLIGSRECLRRQIALIRGGWKAIERQLRSIVIDPSFSAFAQWCALESIPLLIVSDGIDRVIETLLARENIRVDAVYANRLVESAASELSLVFPYASKRSGCSAGLCKCERLAMEFNESLRVVIGDGGSDFCWAPRADQLFAKSALQAHCHAENLVCTPFDNFDSIRLDLAAYLNRKPSLRRDASTIQHTPIYVRQNT